MSTTSHKEMAILYSGVKDGKPLAMVLEIRVGAVDRGACIREFSQYPAEVEYLWVPCSFLEPVGARYLEVSPHGPVTVIPLRVNANLKTMVIEDLVAQKKQMHLASFRYVLDELGSDLRRLARELDAEERLRNDWKPGDHTVSELLKRIDEQSQVAPLMTLYKAT